MGDFEAEFFENFEGEEGVLLFCKECMGEDGDKEEMLKEMGD